MSARKLWMVTHYGATFRPESKVKAYDIYVRNASGSYWATGQDQQRRYAHVYVDERDGRGFQLYERVDLHETEL